MMATFNVLTEPWIPVVDLQRRECEMGVLEVLVNAHQIGTLTDPAPSVEIGLYRLLIAFVLDAFQISRLDQVESLLLCGRFDEDAIMSYVCRVGRKRFDLFDPEHPFLQTAPLAGADEAPSVAVRLFRHLPSGTNPIHFNHSTEDSHGFCPADCAKMLSTVAPFMTAGGAGFSPSVNGAPPWYLIVRGESLFETLALNAYAIGGEREIGVAAWRSSEPVRPKAERSCRSFLEALTWQPRRVRLIPGDGGTCTHCGRQSPVLIHSAIFSYGYRSTGGWTDPQVAYRYDNEGPSPLRPREDRELWRDMGPLMLLRRDDYVSEDRKTCFSRPAIVDQFIELGRDRMFPKERVLTADAYGMRTDLKMKIFEWQHESLAVPGAIASNPRACRQIQSALALAESVSWAIGSAIKRTYPRQGKSHDDALGRSITAARRRFWAALRPFLDRDLIGHLSSLPVDDFEAEEQLMKEWKGILRQLGSEAFEDAIATLDTNAAALRRQVDARGYLAAVLSFNNAQKGARPKKRGDRDGD